MRLGAALTNPGELRTLVEFDNPTLVQDGSGAQSATWARLDEVYVKWTHEHGAELVQSEALQARRRATVRRRYSASVTLRTSVLKDGERWQVISLDDIGERHEYLELVVERAVGSA